MEEKNWSKIENRMPRGYKWTRQWAKKKNRKGRAMGGMMIGVRDEMAIQEEEIREDNEGVMCRRVKAGREVWIVVAVYVNGDMEQKVEKMRGWMERQSEKERVIVGGNFNARTGTEGGGVRGMEEEKENL